MNSKTHHLFGLIIVATAVAALTLVIPLSLADENKAVSKPGEQPMAMAGGCPMCQMQMKHVQTLAKLKEILAQAQETAQAEKAVKTQAKIKEAQDLLEQQHQAMHEKMKQQMEKMHDMKCPMCGQPVDTGMTGEKTMPGKAMDRPAEHGSAGQGMVVNAHCPILGTKLDRSNVPANLTRVWKGQKIGFCCPGCPPQWDKLSDEQKQSKLDAAMR